MKLRAKIMSLGVMGVFLTATVLVVLVLVQKDRLRTHLKEELDKEARNECAAVAKGVYQMLRAQQASLNLKLESDLKVASRVLKQTGEITFAPEKVAWDAVNQLTKQATKVELPKMMVGQNWLGQNFDFKQPAPVVDEVKSLVGAACTIFQRMNDAGDMLRACTNVSTADGKRAISTYIPAVEPDGKPNPVIATVLQGKTYIGRAFVVNAWFNTAYEPIFDANRNVIGALFVGVPQESVKEVRDSIMKTVVGKTGYVYILGGTGDQKGKYLISLGGKRDGENIWEAKDADGRLFIQSIVNKALQLKDGNCDFERYPWKNEGDTTARYKIAAISYFEPWDWVIGAGAYEDDFQDAIQRMDRALMNMLYWTIGGAVFTLVLCGLLSGFSAHRIATPLRRAAAALQDIAQGEGDLTRRLEVHTTDEVGDVAKWFNTFVEKLQRIIGEIAVSARTLAGSSTELSATATQLTSGAEETTAQSATVAAAAEEMATNMNNMATSTEEMSANVKTVAAAIEEMAASIGEVARNAEQAATVAGQAAQLAAAGNENISQLGTAADEIGKVIGVIQDIAEQTNLLALNATIEAARAGEAGKGFAVVATEVKELAKQTAEATEDIRRRIEGIQSSTGNAIQSINEISNVITKVNEVSSTIASAVEEQSTTTKEIAQSISQTASAAETVSQGVAQSAAVSKEITKNIAGVDQAAKQTAQGAAQTQAAGNDLSKLAEQLQGLVGQFKV
ncbi:MAG: methyl-accepting chemotaxis protein [Phycisphaerae bacterium]